MDEETRKEGLRTREEIPEEFTWRMEDMLPSDGAWEELFSGTQEELKGYERYMGRLSESGSLLAECLRLDDEISLKTEILYVYARQKSDQDTGNQIYQELFGRAQSLSFRVSEASAFLVPEILEIPENVLREWMDGEPQLAHYRRLLEQLLEKKAHTLSRAEEELLARSREMAQGASQIFHMFNNADVRFPEIEGEDGKPVRITHGNYIGLMESRDRSVRKAAFEGLYQIYGQFSNTLAAAFSANIRQAVFYAGARHYSSSRAQALSENEIPESVYDNLIGAVREALPAMHRYVGIRKRVLGLEELHMYDLYVPMVEQAGGRIPYEQAKEMVAEALAPLGEEYVARLREGFENRWIDVYENQGKRSGAYSWGAYGTHPYVLLNYGGILDHVFTLAHEMGHALHSYYSDSAQPYTYAGYRIFVAEVASTCNEALLIRHLLEKSRDRRERAYLLNHFLESFRGTLFRQTMFAEFEYMAHDRVQKGETLTAGLLGEQYHKLNEDYFGPEMTVDPQIDFEWSRIPHFYTPFYVYQYATGFSAAIYISSRILAGDEAVLEGYRKFLKGGCSQTPIQLLRLCGVDMESPEPVRGALQVFEELLDQFETLATELGE